MNENFRPFNQDTHPEYNTEPGEIIIPGSNRAREMAKWEQFPSKWTAGFPPGNPYTYRQFPKMVYRAERFEGNVICGAVQPDPSMFTSVGEYNVALNKANALDSRCQRVVHTPEELQRAMEAGFRESPAEACEHAHARETRIANETAVRIYQDRNMSEAARAEAELVTQAEGGQHQPVITPEKVAEAKDGQKRRPGRPRKTA